MGGPKPDGTARSFQSEERNGREMMRQLCGRALMMAIVVLALGCGGDGKAELPDKAFAPPRGAPAKMKVPPMTKPPKAE